MSNKNYKLVILTTLVVLALKRIRGNRKIKELRTTVNHSRLLSLQLPTLPRTLTVMSCLLVYGTKSPHVDDPRRHFEEPKCPWHMTPNFISYIVGS